MNEKDVGLIYRAIPEIMAEIPSIYKDRKNTAQNYSFRGIDDVYNAVNPVMAKHGIFMRAEILGEIKREERPSKSGGTMAFVQVHVRYFFVAKDGSSVYTDSLGEGMDSGDKATPKAMSIAQKYAILQMFCIPTADPKDVEDDNPEPAPKKESDPLDEGHRGKGPEINLDRGLCSLEEINALAKAVGDLTELGLGEDYIFASINKRLRGEGEREIVEASELSHENAIRIIKYLHNWKKAVQAKAAAKKEQDDVPADY